MLDTLIEIERERAEKWMQAAADYKAILDRITAAVDAHYQLVADAMGVAHHTELSELAVAVECALHRKPLPYKEPKSE